MKKVIWTLMVDKPDAVASVMVCSTYQQANEQARAALKPAWEGQQEHTDEDPGEMPPDWEDALVALQEGGFYDTLVSVTHHTVETDALEAA